MEYTEPCSLRGHDTLDWMAFFYVSVMGNSSQCYYLEISASQFSENRGQCYYLEISAAQFSELNTAPNFGRIDIIIKCCMFPNYFWSWTFLIQKEAGIPKRIIKVEDISGLSKFIHAFNMCCTSQIFYHSSENKAISCFLVAWRHQPFT